ncbi:MAG: hypothetical protein OEL53_17950 [Rhodospirillales bacterium]|nr:hypothetical protein [Rhodospirillales bacterium]
MTPFRLALSLLFALTAATSSLAGETLTCPDLAQATQVADCPTEEQLRYTYLGYCGDDRRMYEKDNVTCTAYEHFRDLKNIALWESVDGVFQGYVSCALPPAQVKVMKATRMSVVTQGSLTKLVCAYPNNVALTRRSKTPCRVDGDGDCGPGGTDCKVVCD